MGAWRQLRHRLEAILPPGRRLSFVARRSASSPATGFYATHQQQEAALIEHALGAAAPVAPGSDAGNGLVTHAEVRREEPR